MTVAFETEAARILEARVAELRALTFEQARALPEASGDERLLAGIPCSITVFAQSNPHSLPNTILVTVQVARRGFLASRHIERGLVFSPKTSPREASRDELQSAGG
jgi:hypothetical protein